MSHDNIRAATGKHLVELDDRQCWELIGTEPVGRLAWQGPAGITVVPVNFRVESEQVLVRTTPYSAAALECDDSPVAFEVDSIDPTTRSGWSVLVRGTAHVEVAGPDDVDVWPTGPRALRLRVDPVQVTGRRLPPPD